MAEIVESKDIRGVYVVQLQAFGDGRGSFRETFRKAWFPQRTWEMVQTNCSHSAAGVVRGLHYHFHQVDYWYVAQGRIRAVLFDMRPASPTFRAVLTLDLDAGDDRGLFIPVGVAHGFAALTQATLIYVVDNYFDGRDEYGVAWDDPEINVDWGVTNPIVSPRDQRNPRYADLPAEARPR